jgi:outer membrane protein TolC
MTISLVLLGPAVFAESPPSEPAPRPIRLTLDEAKQRALAANKLLAIGSLNIEGKGHATGAMQSNYGPKVLGVSAYLHFDRPLGSVLTTRERPALGIPPQQVAVNVFEQNSAWNILAAVQPITDLLKVRQGVRIARADEQIAHAQYDKGAREVVSGVEQLYWGILAVERIRAAAAAGVQGTEALAKSQSLEGRTALVEAKQGLQEAAKQLAGLEAQLLNLLDLPACIKLELTPPDVPALPFACADEAIALAIATSPELREAHADLEKANAAVAAGRLEYVPSIALTGGYMNQTAQSYVQDNVGFVGVFGSYTFVDWGKRKHTIRERKTLVAMASLKIQQTEDTVRQNTLKAWREYAETAEAAALARELAGLRAEATKKATSPDAMLTAAKAQATAGVDAIKAELAHQQAFVTLTALIGK